jgi:ACR3 family arsenite transporter
MQTTPVVAPAPMSLFERYLSVWVLLCIVAGIALGQWFSGFFQAIGQMEVAKVNLPVGLYIVIPVLLAQWLRKRLLARGPAAFDAAMQRLGPWSIAALLATLVLLFAFQGQAILQQPLVIALLAVPILIQVVFNSALAYGLNRSLGEAHNVAGPSALIGASNFFELAVAAAISLFGLQSGAALATVVGVLIEVPVMLLVVRVVNGSKGWYEAGIAKRS